MKPSKNIENMLREDLTFQASQEMRQELWAQIESAQTEPNFETSTSQDPTLWRIIMTHRITHIAAAILLLVIGLIAFSWPNSPSQTHTMFSLVSAANAAEYSLFSQVQAIRHMVNEITLHPQTGANSGELLDKLTQNPTEENNIAFINAYLCQADLPLTIVGTSGAPEFFRLGLSHANQEAVTLTDESWYDSATGRFARIIRQGKKILFANAYDGEALYKASPNQHGIVIDKQNIDANFQAPANPLEFLGLAAGLAAGIPQQHFPPVQDVYEDNLTDGTPVKVYQLGFKSYQGDLKNYYLFKQNQDDQTLAEITCLFNKEIISEHRRVLTDTVDESEVTWDLQNLQQETSAQTSDVEAQGLGVSAKTDPSDFAAETAFTVTIFANPPTWTQEASYVRAPDPTGHGQLYASIYTAQEGRHVLITMAASFNLYMETMLAKAVSDGRSIEWNHTTKSGYRIYRQDRRSSAFWTGISLKNCGFEPVENREGFFCQTPAGFYFCIVVNGPVSQQEMIDLANNLIPATEYQAEAQ